jgi:hypothetical protein
MLVPWLVADSGEDRVTPKTSQWRLRAGLECDRLRQAPAMTHICLTTLRIGNTSHGYVMP